MNTTTVQELKQLRDNGTEHQLIDVREAYEVQIGNLGGLHIPMAEIVDRAGEVRKDIPVIVHCRSGKRSAAVIDALERMQGYTNLSNLTGGYLAWAEEIDTSLPSY